MDERRFGAAHKVTISGLQVCVNTAFLQAQKHGIAALGIGAWRNGVVTQIARLMARKPVQNPSEVHGCGGVARPRL